jgi:replicative DNA helicase
MSNDDALRKVPPQNLESERDVLGAVIVRNDLFDAVADVLDGDDFYREMHRVLWRGIAALAAARKPIDMVTLADALKPRWQEIGGAAYITELVAGVPAPSMALHYAAIVREKALQRALAAFASETAATAYEPPTQWSPDWTEELLAATEYGVAEIASKAVRKPERRKAETLSTVLWKLEHGVEESVPSGFASLDQSFGGFNVGHVTVLAARTSKGKTGLAVNFAINAAKAGFATAFFTLEMTGEEMWTRALGCEAQVDMFSARRRGFREGEKERVETARRTLESLPLEILYRPSMRPRDLRLECKRVVREMGSLKLVIVDYFNLMRGDRHERERWREMQEAVLALKALAGELGIPLLLLSQINREIGEDERPSLANLRDTGATEEHASNVMFIHQPKNPLAEADPARYALLLQEPEYWEDVEVTIGKQRNGPAGLRIPMQFKKQWGAFRDKSARLGVAHTNGAATHGKEDR